MMQQLMRFLDNVDQRFPDPLYYLHDEVGRVVQDMMQLLDGASIGSDGKHWVVVPDATGRSEEIIETTLIHQVSADELNHPVNTVVNVDQQSHSIQSTVTAFSVCDTVPSVIFIKNVFADKGAHDQVNERAGSDDLNSTATTCEDMVGIHHRLDDHNTVISPDWNLNTNLIDNNVKLMPRTAFDNSIVPMEDDVLFGRGTRSNTNPGNKQYRAIVEIFRPRYLSLSDTDVAEKTAISQEIVNIVNEWGGLFLKFDKPNGKWFQVSNNDARKKASQALREGRT